MTSWYPGLAGINDKGFGGSRGGDPINGVVIHHTANGGGLSALGYVANANSRNSHPTYLVQSSGASFGIVHPDRRPYSTAGRPDSEAVSFEVDNSGGAPSWPTSAAAKEAVAQIIAWHYKQSPRHGHGIARNIPGVVQREFFVAWHSQYLATTCPGPDMLAHLDSIIARALAIASPSTPTNPNTTVTPGSVVGVKAAFGVYASAAAARADGAPKSTYPAGNYTVFKTDKGDAVNLSRTAGKAGGWAMISKLGLTAPAPVVYKVVFDDTPNNAASSYQTVNVNAGQLVARPVDPTREGFDFLGWYDLNGSVTTAYDFAKPVAGLLTLVARWSATTPAEPEPEPTPVDWNLPELGGSETANGRAAFAGLLAEHPRARKRTYYGFAAAALLVSFGPDVVTAGVLADGSVPTFVAYVTLSASILLKVGTALGFIAASNTK